jgi:hypothetical protein
VALAARGARNLDNGVEAITDETEKNALREQAKRIRMKSLVVAVALTIVAMILPLQAG